MRSTILFLCAVWKRAERREKHQPVNTRRLEAQTAVPTARVIRSQTQAISNGGCWWKPWHVGSGNRCRYHDAVICTQQTPHVGTDRARIVLTLLKKIHTLPCQYTRAFRCLWTLLHSEVFFLLGVLWIALQSSTRYLQDG